MKKTSAENENANGNIYVPTRLRYRCSTFCERLKNDGFFQKLLLLIIVVVIFGNYIVSRNQDSFEQIQSNLLILSFGILSLVILVGIYSDGFLDVKYYDAFLSIGFKNSIGIPPILICQQKIDNSVIILFDNVGIPLFDWERHKDDIESTLNISISQIQYGKNYRQIIIKGCQGKFDFSKNFIWSSKQENDNQSKNDSLLILGESIFGGLSISLNDYPHILIGGATGSGKTLLLKLLLMQCINKDYIVNIADFKGGVDFGRIWENHCTFVTDISNTTKKLDAIISELENRKKLYAKNGYKNISEYNKHELIKHKRIIFACDELAELLDTTGLSTKEKEPIKKIQNQLSSLARLGRAFGIHLILATQRPDANIISGQIKNNISYKICGRADQVLSQIILDNTDASTYIPADSKGLFLNQDGTLFKAYLFDETTDIQGGGRMHTEQ